VTDAAETTVRLERLIPAPPEALYALWSAPEALARWWAPDGYVAAVHAWDLTPGGLWRTSLRGPDGRSVATRGAFRIVDPPSRLVFTWAWEDDAGVAGHESEVSVDFSPTPGGTRLTLVHARFESCDARDRHDRGWQASLDRQTQMVA
jgi:uncharacterized protein YndB with AHSA1/START domain